MLGWTKGFLWILRVVFPSTLTLWIEESVSKRSTDLSNRVNPNVSYKKLMTFVKEFYLLAWTEKHRDNSKWEKCLWDPNGLRLEAAWESYTAANVKTGEQSIEQQRSLPGSRIRAYCKEKATCAWQDFRKALDPWSLRAYIPFHTPSLLALNCLLRLAHTCVSIVCWVCTWQITCLLSHRSQIESNYTWETSATPEPGLDGELLDFELMPH